MTSLDSTQQGAELAGTPQPGQPQAQAPVPPGVNPAAVPGLPPTALSMQMQSANDQQYQDGQMQAMGAELGPPLYIQPPIPGTPAGGGPVPLNTQTPDPQQYAQSSLQDLAEQMARSYGLNFSRGSLVDEQGNFTMTPDQLALGGDLSDTAANMNRIAQAINDARVQQQQNKATAALQAGAGLIQKRGRGSLAAMQSNFYQAMAQNYTDPNLLPEQQDFSYWIQKEGLDDAAAIRDKEDEDLGLDGDGGGGGGGGGHSSGAPLVTTPTADDPFGSTDTGPRGAGDVVTSGPHAGQRPVYTYDPISKTTTVSWEDA